MTMDEYAQHVNGFLAEMRAVTEAKNPDYSAGSNDAMAHYHDAAVEVGVTPLQVWLVLLTKHLQAIRRYARTGTVSSEAIRGRFVDVANYAMLGAALVEDLARRDGPDPIPEVTDGD